MTDPTIPEETPAEPVEDERTRFLRIHRKVIQWAPPEDEKELTQQSFDTAKAWEALLTLPSVQEMLIKESNQKRLNLVVGINVSQEFPWKQVLFKDLRDNLFDDLSNGQVLYNAFQGFNIDHHVLLGYVPILTQDADDPPPGDPFILYINPADTKVALAIIHNMETFERLMINKRLSRQPRKWISLGSEDEVNLTIAQSYQEPVDVEIQSVYPLTISKSKHFTQRFTNDVRDGYVELIPAENVRFENVLRRRITVAIQSSLARIDIHVQTDHTFPTNAWTQYLYEVKQDEDCLDEESEDEEGKDKPGTKPPAPEPLKIKPPPQVSENMKFLLEILEFNQVDMYRDDYPRISNKNVMHYTTPSLEETLCFANIAKSHHRYVCGYDWYPALAGLIVTSYSFSTAATIESGNIHTVNTKHDVVERAVLEPNPILMWSFNDNLNYKLEFESPLEVVVLSFCPYDPNILLGGATNGQIILWDLLNRADKLDYEEMLSSAQMSYRVIMNEFLKWTIQIDEKILVSPTAITQLENSQKSTVTAIHWLGSRCLVNSSGKIYHDHLKKHRFFMTSSMDGTVSFWNLEGQGKKVNTGVRRDLPKALAQSESLFKGKILKPIFTVVYVEPITAVLADAPVFEFRIKDKDKSSKNIYNYAIEPVEKAPPELRQTCIASTFYGRIQRLRWLGLYADADNRESVSNSIDFARVHDGPIIALKRNPVYPWLFVSIGRTVLAVWKEDYNYSPIFWRKRQNNLTAVAWSETRSSTFFVTRIDGCFEVWDILSRDDDACLNDVLGGGVVTKICEHKLNEPEKLLGIGDYNSSLRMVKLPKSFYLALQVEHENVKEYILREESRKKDIQAWEQKFYEKNKEFIEAKRQAERDAHKELERLEKEAILNATRKAKEEEEAKRNAEPPARLSYTDCMKKQWYDLNLNRLLNILMSRKRVNEKLLKEQTVLEKERIVYEMAKKEALAQVLKRVSDEVAAIRLRIHPQEIPDLQRNDMIQSSVNNIMQSVSTYDDIEDEANLAINQFYGLDDIDYAEFLRRGEQRHKLLNKSLGGSTQRYQWYEKKLADNLLFECDWGLEMFMDLLQSTDMGSLPPSDTSLLRRYEEAEEEAEEADIENV